jgi:hypothetical protein
MTASKCSGLVACAVVGRVYGNRGIRDVRGDAEDEGMRTYEVLTPTTTA